MGIQKIGETFECNLYFQVWNKGFRVSLYKSAVVFLWLTFTYPWSKWVIDNSEISQQLFISCSLHCFKQQIVCAKVSIQFQRQNGLPFASIPLLCHYDFSRGATTWLPWKLPRNQSEYSRKRNQKTELRNFITLNSLNLTVPTVFNKRQPLPHFRK